MGDAAADTPADTPADDEGFRRAAQSLDSWTLIISLISNLLHLFMRWRKTGSGEATTTLSFAIAGYTVLQLALHRTRPDTYYKHRYGILFLARLLRMLSMGKWVLQTRRWSAAPTPAHDAIVAYVASSHALRPISAALALLVLSGSLHSAAHSLTTPLPLPTQAAFHALYLALMLAHAPSAAHSLALTPYGQTLQRACEAVNAAVVQAVGQDRGLLRRMQALPRACEQHSALLLVIFVQLFFGTVLPLLHARRVQRGLLAAVAKGQEAAGEHGGCRQVEGQLEGQEQGVQGVQGSQGVQGQQGQQGAQAGERAAGQQADAGVVALPAVPRTPLLLLLAAAVSWLLAVLLSSVGARTTADRATSECKAE